MPFCCLSHRIIVVILSQRINGGKLGWSMCMLAFFCCLTTDYISMQLCGKRIGFRTAFREPLHCDTQVSEVALLHFRSSWNIDVHLGVCE